MIEVNSEFWKEVRCEKCRRLICYEYVFAGRIMYKCPHCNHVAKIDYRTPKNLIVKLIEQDAQNYNPNEEIIVKRKVSISDLKGGEKTESQ